MQVSISYVAPDVASLVDAIRQVQALGIAPSVAVAPSTLAPRSPLPRKGEGEPNVAAYLAARGETTFRLYKAEKEAGLTRDQAAALRMESEGWQAESMGADDSPAQDVPHDGTPLF